MLKCPDLTWNQVFLELDRRSREETVLLKKWRTVYHHPRHNTVPRKNSYTIMTVEKKPRTTVLLKDFVVLPSRERSDQSR